MDAETKTFSEQAQETEEQIKAEESVSSADKEKALQSQQQLAELEKDPDFQKEVPKEFNKNPAWRKLYWERKQAEREREEYKTKTTTFETKVNELQQQLESLNSRQISETDLNELAKRYGYKLSKEELKEEVIDELETLFANATPEEKQWWTKYNKAIFNKVNQHLSPMAEFMVEYRLDKSEQRAKAYIDDINQKYGLKLDFKKDIEPELRKMIQSNRNLTAENTDIFRLVRELIADKGIEFGKRLSEEEIRKQNEIKKKANMETGVIPSSEKDEFAGKSLKEIMRLAAKKEGLSGFD